MTEAKRQYMIRWRKKNAKHLADYYQKTRSKRLAQSKAYNRENPAGRCGACRCAMRDYHVDHVIPISRGGSDNPENLQLLCPPCNLSKGSKTMHEWRAHA